MQGSESSSKRGGICGALDVVTVVAAPCRKDGQETGKLMVIEKLALLVVIRPSK